MIASTNLSISRISSVKYRLISSRKRPSCSRQIGLRRDYFQIFTGFDMRLFAQFGKFEIGVAESDK
jgi:hypothetical protein